MRVLVVTNMFPGRNPECMYAGVFVKEQVDFLRSHAALDVDVFVIDGFLGKIEYLSSIFKIFGVLKSNKYDVIHVHYGLSALFLLWPFQLRRNIILTLHGGDIISKQGKWLQVWLTRLILRKVSGVIVISEEMVQAVGSLNSNLVVIPCGIDTDFFKSSDSDCRANRVLFAGAPSRWVKNYPLFEEIMAEYKKLDSSVEVVALDGFSREQVKDLLVTSKALVMTSHSEGSPQIVKEALSCDTSVVSSNVGDVACVLGGVSGTSIFNSDVERPVVLAKMIVDKVAEAARTQGERRRRVLSLNMDNKLVVERIRDFYIKVSR